MYVLFQVPENETKEEKPRTRPAAIDLHDLEQELSKIHTGGTRHIILQPQPVAVVNAIQPVDLSLNTTPTDGVSLDPVREPLFCLVIILNNFIQLLTFCTSSRIKNIKTNQ